MSARGRKLLMSAGVADGAIALFHLGVIAVGAPHRREALRACEETIDALKERVPIWKREHTDEGADWVGCEGCARPGAESANS